MTHFLMNIVSCNAVIFVITISATIGSALALNQKNSSSPSPSPSSPTTTCLDESCNVVLVEQEMLWRDAGTACENLGRSLGATAAPGSHDKLKKLLIKHVKNGRKKDLGNIPPSRVTWSFWLGGVLDLRVGKWVWLEGDEEFPMYESHWKSGFPQKLCTKQQRCLQAVLFNSAASKEEFKLEWEDRSCWDSTSYPICGKKVIQRGFLSGKTTKRCVDYDNCYECIRDKRCGWCPWFRSGSHVYPRCEDYAKDDSWCSDAFVVKYDSECNAAIPDYSAKTAYDQLLLSAVAYSKNQDKCLAYMNQRQLFVGNLSGNFVVEKVFDWKCYKKFSCSAFIAVSKHDKLISLAFRGTKTGGQLWAEFIDWLRKDIFGLKGKLDECNDGNARLLSQFVKVWRTFIDMHETEVKKIFQNYSDYKVWITGHSLGGALANIAAAVLTSRKIVLKENVIHYTFGEPRVGNYYWAIFHDRQVQNSWRVVHGSDMVVTLPMKVKPTARSGPWQHGMGIYYDSGYMSLLRNPDFKSSMTKFSLNSTTTDYLNWPSTKDHKQYFGYYVGTWCEDNEHLLVTTTTTATTMRPDTRNGTKNSCSLFHRFVVILICSILGYISVHTP